MAKEGKTPKLGDVTEAMVKGHITPLEAVHLSPELAVHYASEYLESGGTKHSSRTHIASDHNLLTSDQVAARFNVHPRTIRRWHESGQLQGFTTPGGHRRFKPEHVEKLMKDLGHDGE